MKFDMLNKWLTLIANFGMIAGLVLVAMQMNFNARAINLQNAIEVNRDLNAGELALMGDSAFAAWTAGALHPEELTEEQFVQLWAYLQNAVLAGQNSWLAYNEGLTSQSSWAHTRRLVATYLTFRVGSVWWSEYKAAFQPEFVEAIDGELADAVPMQVGPHTLRVLEEIRTLGAVEVSQPLGQ